MSMRAGGGSTNPKIKAAIIRTAMVGVVYEGYHRPHSEGLRGVAHTPGSSAKTLQAETTHLNMRLSANTPPEMRMVSATKTIEKKPRLCITCKMIYLSENIHLPGSSDHRKAFSGPNINNQTLRHTYGIQEGFVRIGFINMK